MSLRLPAALLACALLPVAAKAYPYPPKDPDWPCQQLLVPKLAPGSFWAGSTAPTAPENWRDDQATSDLVGTAINRDTDEKTAIATVTKFVRRQPAAKRKQAAATLFAELVDEANDERQQIIAHIDELSRRQHTLGTLVENLNATLAKTQPTDPGYTDLQGQRDFNIQAFQSSQATIRYACEVPGTYDRRLGLLAKALQGLK